MKRYLNVDSRIKGKPNELIDKPVVIRINDFTEKSVARLHAGISKAHELKQPIIPLVVDSYGGSVYSLLSMMSAIKESTIPVATICESKAMSAGAVLFSCGQWRYMAPHATMMIHEVSSFQYGKTEELKADAHETNRLNKLIFKLMAENCGKDANYFLKLVHDKNHADWFLPAKEAKKHNLATEIRVPELRIDISVDITFG